MRPVTILYDYGENCRVEKGETVWKLAIETLADLLTEFDKMKF